MSEFVPGVDYHLLDLLVTSHKGLVTKPPILAVMLVGDWFPVPPPVVYVSLISAHSPFV